MRISEKQMRENLYNYIVMPQLGKVLIGRYAKATITQLTGIYRLLSLLSSTNLQGCNYPKVDSSQLLQVYHCVSILSRRAVIVE